MISDQDDTGTALRPKLFRDPVHDIISFGKDTPEDRTLLAVIEAREFQRLRRIRQLGLTNLVYHGAEHSRFVHSMGVAHLARRMTLQLRPKAHPADRLAVIAAALCHDLGHGPFSHVAERLANFHHESVTIALVTTPGSEVHAALAAYDPSLPARVASYYEKGSASPPPLQQVVSSQLDADRMDYILRDGLATGVKIGVFDLARILGMLEEHDGGRVRVNERAVEAVEGYLLARFHMYKQVYLHKASRAAERMLEAALRRARVLANAAVPGIGIDAGPFDRMVLGTATPTVDIPLLDDMDVWVALKRWSVHDDPILARLAGGLVNRRLFKTRPIPLGREGDAVLEETRALARRLGEDPDFAVLVDSSADTPYSPYIPGRTDLGDAIQLSTRDGRAVPIESLSHVVRLLGRIHYRVRRLIVPETVYRALPEPVMAQGHDELAQPELPFDLP
jgi:HD superfamily phosphohydrolase